MNYNQTGNSKKDTGATRPVKFSALLEDQAVRGLEKLLHSLWAKTPSSPPPVDVGAQLERSKEKVVGGEVQCANMEVGSREEIKESRGRATDGVIDQPPQNEARHSLNPLPFTKERFGLSVMQGNLLMQPYRQIPPSLRLSNPMAELNAHNYMMFTPNYRSSEMPGYRQTFPPPPPRPIFGHCAIHAGIAYFIHSSYRRQVFSSDS